MAIAMLVETPGMTAETYDRITPELEIPPECRVHVAGPNPDGSAWRVVTVWDSPEAAQRFLEGMLTPTMERHGVSQWGSGTREVWPVHNLILAGAQA